MKNEGYNGRVKPVKGWLYIMVAYYANWTVDEVIIRKRMEKSYPTGLPDRGNKRKAEVMCAKMVDAFKVIHESTGRVPTKDELMEFDGDVDIRPQGGILFADYMEAWLRRHKSRIQDTTFDSYSDSVDRVICPYFRELGVLLTDLTPDMLMDFYDYRAQTVSWNSVKKNHANIHKALRDAVKPPRSLIPYNPASKDYIELPTGDKYVSIPYNQLEANALLQDLQDSMHRKLLPVTAIALFYGLRRSEVLGIRWDAIDFHNHTIGVWRSTVQVRNAEGRRVVKVKDKMKNKSSYRTMPLVPPIARMLEKLRKRQTECRQVCGTSYCTDYLGMVMVDDLGYIIKPSYVTDAFPKFLERHEHRRIRFHDLRHSCASLLLANGVSMKEIQDYLGHSDFSTTANLYAHLYSDEKKTQAAAMERTIAMEFIG